MVRDLRIFGLVLGGVVAGATLVRAAVSDTRPAWWLLAVAALLALAALVRPAVLRPLHAGWTRMARGLAWINTRVLLGLVFFVVLAPLGLLMRLAGRDALGLRFDPDAATYAARRPPRPPDHMRRQF